MDPRKITKVSMLSIRFLAKKKNEWSDVFPCSFISNLLRVPSFYFVLKCDSVGGKETKKREILHLKLSSCLKNPRLWAHFDIKMKLDIFLLWCWRLKVSKWKAGWKRRVVNDIWTPQLSRSDVFRDLIFQFPHQTKASDTRTKKRRGPKPCQSYRKAHHIKSWEVRGKFKKVEVSLLFMGPQLIILSFLWRGFYDKLNEPDLTIPFVSTSLDDVLCFTGFQLAMTIGAAPFSTGFSIFFRIHRRSKEICTLRARNAVGPRTAIRRISATPATTFEVPLIFQHSLTIKNSA